MGRGASASATTRYFGDSRCRSIWQWQLIIAFATVAIAVGVAALSPQRFNDLLFAVGVVSIIVVTMITISAPWHRIASSSVLSMPIIDAVLIGLMVPGATTAATLLWVFPVAWIASYFSVLAVVAVLSLITALQLTTLLLRGLTVDALLSLVLSVLALIFIAVIMAVGAERNRSARRLLSAQSDRLAHALQRVQDQRARNRRVLDSLEIGLARVNEEGIVEGANTAFRELYGLDSAAQLNPARAVEYRERRGEGVPVDETLVARAARRELFRDEIVWLFGLDGRWRALRASTKVIDRSDDGLLLLVEDITETIDPRAGEDAARRSIAHELRNPLTAVLGHIDLLLERDDLDAAARKQLGVVEHAGTRIEQLINRALATPGERHDDRDECFDLVDVATSSIEGFAPVAEVAGVAIDPRLPPGLRLFGNAFRLRQVVDNVLGNAIKFAPRGGRVVVQAQQEPDDEVRLLIADDGIGIPSEDLPHIFEREFRSSLAQQRGIPGTGLGLSISRDIVAREGGRFEVESQLGQGTKVSILLPVSLPTQERNRR